MEQSSIAVESSCGQTQLERQDTMANGDLKAYLGLLSGFFNEYRTVLRQKSQPPPRLALNYNRAFLVLLGLYPNRWLLGKYSHYKRCNRLLLANSTSLLLPIIFAMHESTNVVDMGEDMAWIIGISLIVTKNLYVCWRANQIDELIEDFNYYERCFRPTQSRQLAELESDNVEIRRWQRLCYLVETTMNFALIVFMVIFNVAICVQPLFSERDLPYHAVFPFGWHNSVEHPRAHMLIYIWQALTSQFNLLAICQIDTLGIHNFLHTALNLKILCLEMHKLGKLQLTDLQFHAEFRRIIQFHQHLISTVQKNNGLFHGTFIAQMIASFALISMSTFEAMAAAGDPKMAAKFLIFMFVTFVQLSYWCLAGTLVHTQSTDVAQAAFELKDWHTRSVFIQRNILFMIKRSQKPLLYAAKPFPPFTLATYSIILQQCYRILALLREAM
ncbi:odorant receptor 47b [Drosophila hydei]|uniref:Odorant receptor n=1 Tax=Drosophila hydei TaxID=7224 RepID=A0A6J1MAZ1_DROHY|nr:odorant receptor 47b [Drosophila hydei]